MFAVGSTAVIAFEDLFPQVIMSIRGENAIEHNEATRVLACTIWSKARITLLDLPRC